jgi:hypothetical protein
MGWKRGTWRGVRPSLLIALGLAIGLGAPAAASSVHPKLAKAASNTRSASCTGINFHPIDSEVGFSFHGTEIFRNDSGADNIGFFACSVSLPNGAVVAKVQFTLFDNSASDAISFCGLFRNQLVPSAHGASQPVGTPPVPSGTPGYVRTGTSNITNATINNKAFSYWLQCQIGGGQDDKLRIVGASVVSTGP